MSGGDGSAVLQGVVDGSEGEGSVVNGGRWW